MPGCQNDDSSQALDKAATRPASRGGAAARPTLDDIDLQVSRHENTAAATAPSRRHNLQRFVYKPIGALGHRRPPGTLSRPTSTRAGSRLGRASARQVVSRASRVRARMTEAFLHLHGSRCIGATAARRPCLGAVCAASCSRRPTSAWTRSTRSVTSPTHFRAHGTDRERKPAIALVLRLRRQSNTAQVRSGDVSVADLELERQSSVAVTSRAAQPRAIVKEARRGFKPPSGSRTSRRGKRRLEQHDFTERFIFFVLRAQPEPVLFDGGESWMRPRGRGNRLVPGLLALERCRIVW